MSTTAAESPAATAWRGSKSGPSGVSVSMARGGGGSSLHAGRAAASAAAAPRKVRRVIILSSYGLRYRRIESIAYEVAILWPPNVETPRGASPSEPRWPDRRRPTGRLYIGGIPFQTASERGVNPVSPPAPPTGHTAVRPPAAPPPAPRCGTGAS